MSDDENVQISLEEPVKKQRAPRVKAEPLLKCYLDDSGINEIGVDEVGRGPLFGRVYTAAVILPKDDSFDHSKMKDSKKFHSKRLPSILNRMQLLGLSHMKTKKLLMK
jgi:ribonuclease HII